VIGLVFATQREAAPFLAAVGASEAASVPVPLFAFRLPESELRGVVAVSGIGTEKAAAAAEMLIRDHGARMIVSPGICGSLVDGVGVGSVVRVTEAHDGDALLRESPGKALACAPVRGPWASLRPARLATVTEAVFEARRRQLLARHADVVEMEALAVARACSAGGVRFVAIKGVSDLADHDGKNHIEANIDSVSEAVARTLVDGLAEFANAGDDSLGLVGKLLRYTKIEHTVFSLPFLFAGAWLGWGGEFRSVRVLVLVLAAGAGARVLGMSVNRIFDRHLDALNPRTMRRELPTGSLSLGTAWGVSAAGLAVYLVACVLLGGWCVRLAPLPLVPLVTYPFLKRFTPLCHFGVGSVLAIAPLGAYVAASQSVAYDSRVAWLTALTFCWLTGSDIIYSLMDRESDLATGVHSLPVALGERGALRVSGALHCVAVVAIFRLLFTSAGNPAGWTAGFAATVGFGLLYVPRIPVPVRFFPISALVGVASALTPILGGVR